MFISLSPHFLYKQWKKKPWVRIKKKELQFCQNWRKFFSFPAFPCFLNFRPCLRKFQRSEIRKDEDKKVKCVLERGDGPT